MEALAAPGRLPVGRPIEKDADDPTILISVSSARYEPFLRLMGVLEDHPY